LLGEEPDLSIELKLARCHQSMDILCDHLGKDFLFPLMFKHLLVDQLYFLLHPVDGTGHLLSPGYHVAQRLSGTSEDALIMRS
jgi:hypothetical protein